MKGVVNAFLSLLLFALLLSSFGALFLGIFWFGQRGRTALSMVCLAGVLAWLALASRDRGGGFGM